MLGILKGTGLLRPRVRFFCIALVAAALAACGGGGGSSGSDLVSRHPVSPNTLSLAVAPTAVSDQAPSTVTLTLTDPHGEPVSGQEVSLSCDATARLADNRVTTDVNGQATTRLYATAVGGGTLKASFRDGDGTGSASRSFSTTITSSGGAGGGTGTGTTSLILNLTDSAGQVVGTTNAPITKNRPGRADATLLDASGNPMANQVIRFQTTIGALSPTSGSALTDAQGVAELTLQAGTQQGAGTLTAIYSDADGDVSRSVGFETLGDGGGSSGGTSDDVLIGFGTGSGFQAGLLGLSDTRIGVGSSLAVTANLVNATDNSAADGFPSVSFTSACATSGKASFDPASATSIGGSAVVSYQPDNGCQQDVVTASVTINGKVKTATSATITVNQSPPNSIQFLNAAPSVLGLKGSAQVGAPESSILSFQVKDSNGNPVGAGQDVAFSVISDNGGFAITSQSPSTTNADGIATVTVRSGTVPFVGSVHAQLSSNSDINATGSVSIQSGVVTEDRFSIAVETLNPRAGNVLGKQVQVTARAADRFGNWAPDGTRINFTTELGDIAGSCETQDGTCSVTWTSQAVQQDNYDPDRASRSCFAGDAIQRDRQGLPGATGCGTYDRFGRNTITAWAVGEESFDDLNGNNIFDTGESWVALPEAFRDDNETGIREAAPGFVEDFQDYNTNGQYDLPGSHFRGLGCSAAAITAGNCSQLANVRASARLVLSTDDVRIHLYKASDYNSPNSLHWESAINPGNAPQQWGDAALVGLSDLHDTGIVAGSGSFVAVVADLNGNAPSNDIKVTFDSGKGLSVVGPTDCSAGNQIEALVCRFSYEDTDTTQVSYGAMAVTVTRAGEAIASKTIPVSPAP